MPGRQKSACEENAYLGMGHVTLEMLDQHARVQAKDREEMPSGNPQSSRGKSISGVERRSVEPGVIPETGQQGDQESAPYSKHPQQPTLRRQGKRHQEARGKQDDVVMQVGGHAPGDPGQNVAIPGPAG